MTRDRFNWRSIQTAPRDGTPIVMLQVTTYVGGYSRQIERARRMCDWHIENWQKHTTATRPDGVRS